MLFCLLRIDTFACCLQGTDYCNHGNYIMHMLISLPHLIITVALQLFLKDGSAYKSSSLSKQSRLNKQSIQRYPSPLLTEITILLQNWHDNECNSDILSSLILPFYHNNDNNF